MDFIAETTMRALVGAYDPVHDFLFAGSARYFWLYCVTGLVIAAYGYRKHAEAQSFRATLLDDRVWLSKSAINDYIIIAVVPMLRVTVLSGLLLTWKPVSAFVVDTLHGFGVSGSVNDGAAIALGAALTLALFIVDDFLRWLAHYTFHAVPELWEFHKVHHSAEVLNFATAERHHPVEVVMTSALIAVGYGAVNGFFIAVFGDKLTVTSVAGANVLLFAANICGGVLRHSPFWISFGPRVEKWIISPAMHQIHHSNKIEHFDKNLGGSLAVWDRIAGTLHIPRGREIEGFGIGAETVDFRSLEVIFFRPFAAAASLLRKRFATAPTPGDQALAAKQ